MRNPQPVRTAVNVPGQPRLGLCTACDTRVLQRVRTINGPDGSTAVCTRHERGE